MISLVIKYYQKMKELTIDYGMVILGSCVLILIGLIIRYEVIRRWFNGRK